MLTDPALVGRPIRRVRPTTARIARLRWALSKKRAGWHPSRQATVERVHDPARPQLGISFYPAAVSNPSYERWRITETAVAVLVLLGVFVANNIEQMPNGLQPFLAMRVTVKNVLLLAAFVCTWPGIFLAVGLYDSAQLRTPRDTIVRVIAACSIGSLWAVAFMMTSASGLFGLATVIYFWLTIIAVTLLLRFSAHAVSRTPSYGTLRKVIVVGTGPRAVRLYDEICPEVGSLYDVIGFVDTHERALHGAVRGPRLGPLEQLESILVRHVVDEVLIALPVKSFYREIEAAIRTCEKMGVQSKYLADVFEPALAKPRLEYASGTAVVAMKVVVDDDRLHIKRAMDLAGAALGLIVLAPLLAAVAVAIKLTSPGPVLFSQERYGFNRRRFKMLKFRTMVANAEELQSELESQNELTGPVFKIRDDPRITRIGRFLRRSSIDELPQLVNVLLGHMSLVGPRPMATRDVHRFEESWLLRRFSVRPGMTGLWQVSGRSNIAFDRWIALDLQYIDEWSLALDVKLLAKTVPAVIKGTGAN
jgi:exopolysaccharide biosynthesis polyprenyl glycosylphosphotransferase